jgi:beta-N-acetylhexosaminidase
MAASKERKLGIVAALSAAVAVGVVVVASSASSRRITIGFSRPQTSRVASTVRRPSRKASAPKRLASNKYTRATHSRLGGNAASSVRITLAKAVGQLLVWPFSGTSIPQSLLSAVRQGEVGGVIFMGDNTGAGVPATYALARELQLAAKSGDNPGLLMMTDQEGGEVKRLSGPPDFSASHMSNPGTALVQGEQTATLLQQAGINVDLAPVADVARMPTGFMAQEQRTFGSTPATVAVAACAFARGLSGSGVGYTLKHFPGLGDAIASTDTGPVSVDEPAKLLYEDGAAYRMCGHNPFALVMVSSASYPEVTGNTPAVLDPDTYGAFMHEDHIDAVTISDDFDAPALSGLNMPVVTAINAGLDMVLYAGEESSARTAYQALLAAAERGSISRQRLEAADAKILALKRVLGLPS